MKYYKYSQIHVYLIKYIYLLHIELFDYKIGDIRFCRVIF